MSLVGYHKVISYTKFEHFGIIHFLVMLWTNRHTNARIVEHSTHARRPTESAWVIVDSFILDSAVHAYSTITLVLHTGLYTHYCRRGSSGWYVVFLRTYCARHCFPFSISTVTIIQWSTPCYLLSNVWMKDSWTGDLGHRTSADDVRSFQFQRFLRQWMLR